MESKKIVTTSRGIASFVLTIIAICIFIGVFIYGLLADDMFNTVVPIISIFVCLFIMFSLNSIVTITDEEIKSWSITNRVKFQLSDIEKAGLDSESRGMGAGMGNARYLRIVLDKGNEFITINCSRKNLKIVMSIIKNFENIKISPKLVEIANNIELLDDPQFDYEDDCSCGEVNCDCEVNENTTDIDE